MRAIDGFERGAGMLALADYLRGLAPDNARSAFVALVVDEYDPEDPPAKGLMATVLSAARLAMFPETDRWH